MIAYPWKGVSVGRRRVLGQRAKGLLAIRPGVFEFTNERDVVVWGKKKKKLVGPKKVKVRRGWV